MPHSTSAIPIWERHFLSGDWEEIYIARMRFVAALEGECITHQRKYCIQAQILEITDFIGGQLKNTRLTGLAHDEFVLVGHYNERPIFIAIRRRGEDQRLPQPGSFRHRQSAAKAEILTFHIEVTGHRDAVQILELVAEHFKSVVCTTIWWWRHSSMTGTEVASTILKPLTTRIYPQFYPDLPDPHILMQSYLESDASLLLMAGPSGTGKTTWIRHFLQENGLNAYVASSERVIADEGMFAAFLNDDNVEVLIIEDAEVFLTSRELDNNPLMSKFLNISDGLIKLPDKKMIFSTNLTDFGRIDAALSRPGRCFGVFHTRTLTLNEAVAAAQVAGLPIPVERREYTLAELFNTQLLSREVRRIGVV